MKGFLAGLVMATAVSTAVSAHDGLHRRIAAVTDRIEQRPDDAALYLKRGELHRRHRDWDAALADLETARRLQPDDPAIELACGRVLIEAGWPATGLVRLERSLEKNVRNGAAHLLRARALVALDRHARAVEAFDVALRYLERRVPEHYVERALAAVEADAGRVDRAVIGLDQGILELGQIPALQLLAVDLEVRRGRHDAALDRLDALHRTSQRRETWLFRRGAVLEEAGRHEEAAAAYAAAIEAIESLPARHRESDATRALEARARAAVRALEALEAHRW